MSLRLLRGDGPILRIGHQGSAALAPANTLAAVEAGLEEGVDVVELDVLGLPDRTLVLGHSHREVAAAPTSLDEALALLSEWRPAAALLADVKLAGVERELVEALRRHGLVERTLASAYDLGTLQALRRLEPRLARSRTYPRDRYGLGARRASAPFRGTALFALRRALPRRIDRFLAAGGASAATLNYRLVSLAVVERCHALGVAVLVWTVDDCAMLERLDELGVDGVITNDPRIFRPSRP